MVGKVYQMKLGYLLLYVVDVFKTVEFYENAFGLKRLFVHESGTYAEMDTGSTKLGFVSAELAKFSVPFSQVSPKNLAPGIEVGFVTR
jgi:hypothetical protein